MMVSKILDEHIFFQLSGDWSPPRKGLIGSPCFSEKSDIGFRFTPGYTRRMLTLCPIRLALIPIKFEL